MNFKRGRSKSRRAGCLLCKPHKRNKASAKKMATKNEQVADLNERENRDAS
jgi:hypothetical protein